MEMFKCTKHNFVYYELGKCPGCNFTKQEVASINTSESNMVPIDNSVPYPNTFKKDAGKLRWSLLPTDALEQVIKVLEFGAVKYGPNQWRELPEFEWVRISDALERHHAKWKRGINIDAESGLLEAAHLACNALFLLEMQIHALGKDNRFVYKKEEK